MRIALALMTFMPAVAWAGLLLIATPDLETWLEQHAQGFARPGAFGRVTEIAPLFGGAFGGTLLFAALLILSRRSQFLIPLAFGPTFAMLCYLSVQGFSDPDWFSLLAIILIGMLVGGPVALVWVIDSARQAASETRAKSRTE